MIVSWYPRAAELPVPWASFSRRNPLPQAGEGPFAPQPIDDDRPHAKMHGVRPLGGGDGGVLETLGQLTDAEVGQGSGGGGADQGNAHYGTSGRVVALARGLLAFPPGPPSRRIAPTGARILMERTSPIGNTNFWQRARALLLGPLLAGGAVFAIELAETRSGSRSRTRRRCWS